MCSNNSNYVLKLALQDNVMWTYVNKLGDAKNLRYVMICIIIIQKSFCLCCLQICSIYLLRSQLSSQLEVAPYRSGWSGTCLYHSFLSCQSVCLGHNGFHGQSRSLLTQDDGRSMQVKDSFVLLLSVLFQISVFKVLLDEVERNSNHRYFR